MKTTPGLDEFQFRDLHPKVLVGTASDRYAGWIGQIYTEERYANRISKRAKTVAGKTFQEQVLPVDSVAGWQEAFDRIHTSRKQGSWNPSAVRERAGLFSWARTAEKTMSLYEEIHRES